MALGCQFDTPPHGDMRVGMARSAQPRHVERALVGGVVGGRIGALTALATRRPDQRPLLDRGLDETMRERLICHADSVSRICQVCQGTRVCAKVGEAGLGTVSQLKQPAKVMPYSR